MTRARRLRLPLRLALTAVAILSTAGCAATVKEIRRHPQQARLERLLAEVLPHTNFPDKHYWVRVADPSKDKIGLAVLPQRHIYLAEAVVAEADDGILRALIAHGIAHHRLHHYSQRNIAVTAQQAAFKAGGQFVPGLSKAHYIGGPAIEFLVSPKQEADADRKTALYLRQMGAPEDDYARALEFLADHGLGERMGSRSNRAKNLRSRAAHARKRAASHAAAR
jgi:hypothetical protein